VGIYTAHIVCCHYLDKSNPSKTWARNEVIYLKHFLRPTKNKNICTLSLKNLPSLILLVSVFSILCKSRYRYRNKYNNTCYYLASTAPRDKSRSPNVQRTWSQSYFLIFPKASAGRICPFLLYYPVLVRVWFPPNGHTQDSGFVSVASYLIKTSREITFHSKQIDLWHQSRSCCTLSNYTHYKCCVSHNSRPSHIKMKKLWKNGNSFTSFTYELGHESL
jgi:hypothetical protein